ncbi:hypothetical protein BGZ98_007401 [Dissophora globulifera]|nr:hypothetical protein BGZ98_007401 [Dissophora globulifera]
MACVFGAGLIFIDTIVKKLVGRDVRILQNHKFLAGSLGLGSGVMIFSSFYNLLPEAKEQLSSELSIFKDYVDVAVMGFFFCGVGVMSLIHWIMHRFDSNANSPGIESDQFIQHYGSEAAAGSHHRSSSLPHYNSYNKQQRPLLAASNGFLQTPKDTAWTAAAARLNGSNSTAHVVCTGCVQEESSDDDEEDDDEESQYNDSEYVDDEVTSLLNNAFRQIGKTPGSRMNDNGSIVDNGDNTDGDGDDRSIEIVIANQTDKILRRADDLDISHDDDDIDHDDDRHHPGGRLKSRESSWSSLSTRSQKPFAPVNKRRKSGNGNGAAGKANKSRRQHHKDCPMDPAKQSSRAHQHQQRSYGAVGPSSSTNDRNNNNNNSSSSTYPTPLAGPARSDEASRLRRTSFPRLKGSNTIYSRHDSLDHAVADDREHADLTEIGIQTALTIAVHKFPEGLITFLSTTADPCLGLSVFFAISVHNLIEGYLIAFPLYIGLHSRAKAFALAAALGGLSQPLGALLGWLILRKVASMGWQVSATGCIYALVAGMMSAIAVNGMWPQAVKCVGRNKTKVVQHCFFGGIAIMGICQAALGAKCDL